MRVDEFLKQSAVEKIRLELEKGDYPGVIIVIKTTEWLYPDDLSLMKQIFRVLLNGFPVRAIRSMIPKRPGQSHRIQKSKEIYFYLAELLLELMRKYQLKHLKGAEILRDVGSLYLDAGQIDQAEAFLDVSVDVYHNLVGDNDWRLTSVLKMLDLLYEKKHKLSEERMICRRVVSIRRKAKPNRIIKISLPLPNNQLQSPISRQIKNSPMAVDKRSFSSIYASMGLKTDSDPYEKIFQQGNMKITKEADRKKNKFFSSTKQIENYPIDVAKSYFSPKYTSIGLKTDSDPYEKIFQQGNMKITKETDRKKNKFFSSGNFSWRGAKRQF